MKPTIKNFPILAIDNKNGFSLKDFVCPEIYESNSEGKTSIFYHTFKNGVKAVIIPCSRFTCNRYTLQGYHKYIPNFQTKIDDDNFCYCLQYSDEFKGLMAIFITE